jgi:hypothetical protein
MPPGDSDDSRKGTLDPHVITLRIEGASHAPESRATIVGRDMAANDPSVPPVVALLVDMKRESTANFRDINTKIDDLAEKVDAVRDDQANLRERVARVETNDKRDAEERAAFGPGGTGRFQVPDMRPPHPSSSGFGTPAPTPAIAFSPTISVGGNAGGSVERPGMDTERTRRSIAPSITSLVSKALQSRVTQLALLACAAISGGVVRHLMSPTPTVQFVTIPASQPTEVVTQPVVVAPVVTAIASTVLDAGSPPPVRRTK